MIGGLVGLAIVIPAAQRPGFLIPKIPGLWLTLKNACRMDGQPIQ